MSTHLQYVINHVFLPPKLPQEDDDNFAKDVSLIRQVLASLKSFQQSVLEQNRSQWLSCIKMIDNLVMLRDHSEGLVTEKLQASLKELKDKDILLLHLRGQNAGLIIRRSSLHYSFESFEIWPTSKAVTSTRGRLRRCFPGPAIRINQNKITDASFLEPLVDMLVKLDAETPLKAMPLSRKAKSSVPEIRDSIDPKLVTEMLVGILRGVGQPHEVPRIYKHTRDEILWKKAYKP